MLEVQQHFFQDSQVEKMGTLSIDPNENSGDKGYSYIFHEATGLTDFVVQKNKQIAIKFKI